MSTSPAEQSRTQLTEIIARHWGFHSLRPLQEEAMHAVLDARDSLVVLPTGGGKSLCYQAPAVQQGGTTVVISPLISLMKDQVDSLQACGVPAIQIDSSQTPAERFAYEMDIRQGAVRLVFVSPERLALTDFYRILQNINVRTFAIDEAHCISHWGHDFRPEYRQLRRLRELFPQASLHAYTATATERVRKDIIDQLSLREPAVLVGNFDRPNLTYRVLPRHEALKQTQEVIDRHPNEAGIIYCIRRADVDQTAAALRGLGHRAMAYHAGLSSEDRRAAQDAFAAEECDLIVATVAFGMGIDRSNIRFVLHAGLPKSLEHYQQETGRAGRDGLEAECVLLYSGADFMTWKYIIEKSAEEQKVEASFVSSALDHLNQMDRYCRGAVCRHRSLVEYFGQEYTAESCGACDICLGDTEPVADAVVIAQKILSCVARVGERFGVAQVVAVLRGQNTERIRQFQHEKLSTYGLLREHSANDVRDWVFQLLGQKALEQEQIELRSGERAAILKLNAASWEVMRGERQVQLIQLARRKKGEKPVKSKADATSWEGVHRGLFEELRVLRRETAEERGWQPYLVFSDATLRELARVRPSALDKMRLIYGVGEAKLRDFGQRFLERIVGYCQDHELSRDNAHAPPAQDPRSTSSRATTRHMAAFDLFRQGAVVEDVMHQMNRSRSTVMDYLAEYIRSERPPSIATWIKNDVYQRVAAAVRQSGTDRLKPIFVALGEKVSYDEIRLVVAHLAAQSTPPEGAKG